jgi:DNA-binding Xre family transcriptional regulator
MPTYRRYFERRMADPAFRRLYEEHCTVCRTTVLLVAEMHRRGRSAEDLAREVGCDAVEVRDLVQAERCTYELVERLCGALGIEAPAECARRERNV